MKGDCIAYQCTEDYISTVTLQKGKMVLHSHSLLTDDSETQKYVVYMYMYVYIPLVIIKLKCRIGHVKVQSCLLIIFQYQPISLPDFGLSV